MQRATAKDEEFRGPAEEEKGAQETEELRIPQDGSCNQPSWAHRGSERQNHQ